MTYNVFSGTLNPTQSISQSDRWFDDDCRVARRCVRLLERDASQVRRETPDDLTAVNAATEACYTRRRGYRQLLRNKRENFC